MFAKCGVGVLSGIGVLGVGWSIGVHGDVEWFGGGVCSMCVGETDVGLHSGCIVDVGALWMVV